MHVPGRTPCHAPYDNLSNYFYTCRYLSKSFYLNSFELSIIIKRGIYLEKKEIKRIIDQYITAYDKFDVETILLNVHEDVEFKNIANGEVNMRLKGITALKNQAEQVVNLFKKREMKIIEHVIKGSIVKNKIQFKGVFATDVPDGSKKGEQVELEGKSIFQFEKGNLILIGDIG